SGLPNRQAFDYQPCLRPTYHPVDISRPCRKDRCFLCRFDYPPNFSLYKSYLRVQFRNNLKVCCSNEPHFNLVYLCSCSCGLTYVGITTADTAYNYNRMHLHEQKMNSLDKEDPLQIHTTVDFPSHTQAWRVLWVEDETGLASVGGHRVINLIESFFIMAYKTFHPYGLNQRWICPITFKEVDSAK
ncbi:unnamed protein product, partial [Amoebophrya sp. A25]